MHERIRRIKVCLAKIGCLRLSKFSKNQDLSKVIEGLCGLEQSFGLVYKLAKFAKAKDRFSYKSEKQRLLEDQSAYDTLLRLSANIKTLKEINSPFAIDLPKEEEEFALTAQEMREEIDARREALDEELENYNEKTDHYEHTNLDSEDSLPKSTDFIEIDQELLNELQKSLDRFISNLNRVFDDRESNNFTKKMVESDFEKQEKKLIKFPDHFKEYYSRYETIKKKLSQYAGKSNAAEEQIESIEKLLESLNIEK